MRILVFDTETTNKWHKNQPVYYSAQPYLMELAALAINTETGVEKELETLVKIPDFVEVDPGAFRAHGISKEKANADGITVTEAMQQFCEIADGAELAIGHNIEFDLNVTARAGTLCGIPSPVADVKHFCTMRESTSICKLPGRYGYKWPKLDEAYRILVNPSGFSGAHRAMNDVRACYEVYKALQANS